MSSEIKESAVLFNVALIKDIFNSVTVIGTDLSLIRLKSPDIYSKYIYSKYIF